MSNNYERSLEAIKAKNGGEVPSDLYFKTIAELSKILFDLTGDFKYKIPQRVAKESLVKRIERLTANEKCVIGVKRKLPNESAQEDSSVPIKTAVKIPRNVLQDVTAVQIVQMKRVMAITPDRLLGLKHEKDLRPLWLQIGMTSKYPNMTGKDKIMERLKTFAENNLRFHGHI